MKTITNIIIGTFLICSIAIASGPIIYPGLSLNESAGFSVSDAGDINGDGYDDIISGAYEYNSSQGRTYIYYGGDIGGTAPDLILAGQNVGDRFGESVSIAGDFNGDGYSDVIIGAPGCSNLTGKAYIYFGSHNGLSTVPNVTITGEGISNLFGISVSKADNRNADSFGDVIIGASGYQSSKGKAYIFYGSSIPSSSISAASANENFTGENSNDYFGYSVSSAGYTDGGSKSWIIIGAYHWNSITGKVYLYDGNGQLYVTHQGSNTFEYFGSSVSDAGDVNNNGHDDIIIGAAHFTTLGVSGAAYVYDPLSGNPPTVIGSQSTNIKFGVSVSGVGDRNGDGYDDVIVGAYAASTGVLTGNGQAFVFDGSSSFIIPAGRTIYAAPSDAIGNGTVSNETFGLSVSGAGDFDGNGLRDIIVGAPAYGVSNQTGKSYLFLSQTPASPQYAQLNLRAFIQGYYLGYIDTNSFQRSVCDINVCLYDSLCQLKDCAENVLGPSGNGIFLFKHLPTGSHSYYIVVEHEGIISTWSSTRVYITNGQITQYSFDALSKVYGGNLVEVESGPTKFALYSGDVNGDCIIDASDMSDLDNDSYNFKEGCCLATDLTGDGYVDLDDVTIGDNNVFYYITCQSPCQ
ncbi:MAG: integrin alpha [bacterium]